MKESVENALKHVQARYFALSAYFTKLREQAQKTGKPVPANVITDYNSAVKDHMRFANEVWKELNASGILVDQIVAKDGKAVKDPKDPNAIKTLRIHGPLFPPSFSSVSGMVRQPVTVGVFVIPVAAYVVGGLLLTAATGVTVAYALKKIVDFKWGPDYSADKRVENYLKTFEALKAAGLSPAEAAKQAGKQTDKPPPPAGEFSWFIIGIGLTVVGGAGYYFYTKKKST